MSDPGLAVHRTGAAWQRTGLSLITLSLLVLHLQADALGPGLVLLIPPLGAGAWLTISPWPGAAGIRDDGVAPALATTGVVAIALVALGLRLFG
jgi:hypothetical protein